MKRAFIMGAMSAVALAGAALAQTAQFGSAAEARAMLDKAALAVKANKAQALQNFTKGEAGFKDRDLYPFCAGADGNFTSHPTLAGQSLRDLKDKTGKAFGADIYRVAEEGKVGEVPYMWTRPGSDAPVQKVTYVTKIGDQVCAVGYYQ